MFKTESKDLEDVKYSASLSMAALECNKNTFGDIYGKCRGMNVAVCGAGPSFGKYKPINGTVHIALNRALLNNNVRFEYFFADDWRGINFMQEEICAYDCMKYLGFTFLGSENVIPECFIEKSNSKKYYTDSFIFKDPFDSRFACDIDKLPLGTMPNIALSVLQVALFMRPKTIFIVGCDATQGHFIEPRSLDIKERNKLNEDHEHIASYKSDKVMAKWKEFRRFAEIHYPDVRIISINPVGLVGIFEDVFQE